MTSPSPLPATVGLGALIRFRNSAGTLPGVLSALRAQTRQPELLVGVDNGSTDGSAAILRAAGATILEWPEPYHHSKVLNFGLAGCPAERVLVLSSHTVLESPDAVERMERALEDPAVACASGKWDADSYYSDTIDWPELRAKGLKLGSIYSNSFGLLRRSLWQEVPFDEEVPPVEDYVWAVEQVRRGKICRRLEFCFRYQRAARPRDVDFARGVFALAARHGLRVVWRGRKATLREILRLVLKGRKTAEEGETLRRDREQLRASLTWRWA